MGLLYFTDPGLSQSEQRQIQDLFEHAEGIAQVLEPKQFPQYGFPNPRADAQMADRVLLAKDGFSFSGKADGDEFVVPAESAGAYKGNHGFNADDEKMNAVFVAAGAGLKKGARPGPDRQSGCGPYSSSIAGPDNDFYGWSRADRGLGNRQRTIMP